jgi:hypothetical protein
MAPQHIRMKSHGRGQPAWSISQWLHKLPLAFQRIVAVLVVLKTLIVTLGLQHPNRFVFQPLLNRFEDSQIHTLRVNDHHLDFADPVFVKPVTEIDRINLNRFCFVPINETKLLPCLIRHLVKRALQALPVVGSQCGSSFRITTSRFNDCCTRQHLF